MKVTRHARPVLLGQQPLPWRPITIAIFNLSTGQGSD